MNSNLTTREYIDHIYSFATTKQRDVIETVLLQKPKITICSGAKRAGKTFILNYLYLQHIQKYRDMGLSFILGGTTQASLRRNVLDDMEQILGKELKLNKSNAIDIFGNKIYCFDGANSDSFKKVRGFTSAGAFLNEATTLHDSFVKEVVSRCSYPGARIYMDTNPENPAHTVKKDYIDKDGQRLDNGQLNIKSFHFTLFDNDKLDPEYVESIVASTPSGMFTDRDIHGKWVSAEGVVYSDFKEDNYIGDISSIPFDKYVVGVDWGYKHHGSIVVLGRQGDTYYIVKEIAKQYKDIDWWTNEALKIQSEYNNPIYWCDTARPEYIDAFRKAGMVAKKADKSVLPGISAVASLIKQRKLLVYRDGVDRFKDEIYQYVWNDKTGEPVKAWDDVLDSVRYACFNDMSYKALQSIDKSILGL